MDRLDTAMVAAGEPQSVSISGGRISSSGGVGGNGDGSYSYSSFAGGSRAADVGAAGGEGGRGTVAVAKQSSRLMFEMFYLTDELVYYALKHEGHVGDVALRLADFMYSFVFSHEVRR